MASTFPFTDLSVSSTLVNSGAVSNTGAIVGNRCGPVTVGTTAGATVLTAADSGAVNVATAASGTQEWTLPAASTAGLLFTFICGNAAGEILVGVQTGDNCIIKASEGGAAVTTSANNGVKNTAATNVLGDRITLVSGGGTTWYTTSQSGIWATR